MLGGSAGERVLKSTISQALPLSRVERSRVVFSLAWLCLREKEIHASDPGNSTFLRLFDTCLQDALKALV
jgi:hypothetical protein